MSFPNYYSLGPNIDFFHAHGVRGVFEEGPGIQPGDGTDLEELKDYVMAEKLWDPSLDHDVLISEFLNGYYGSAAPFIRLYMDTMVSSCRYITCMCSEQRTEHCISPAQNRSVTFVAHVAQNDMGIGPLCCL